MNTNVDSKLQDYYEQFIELQDKLRKSEEERLHLEMKFQHLIELSKEEEHAHYRKLKAKFKKFLDEDRQRHDRNGWIISTLEKIDNRIADLHEKTERINHLRNKYHHYLTKLSYPEQKKLHLSHENLFFPEHHMCLQNIHKYLSTTPNYQSSAGQQYIVPEEIVRNETESTINSKEARNITEGIVKSIHSRYYPPPQVTDKKHIESSKITNSVSKTNYELQPPNRSGTKIKDPQLEQGLLSKPTLNSAYQKQELQIRNNDVDNNSTSCSPTNTQSTDYQQLYNPSPNNSINSTTKKLTSSNGSILNIDSPHQTKIDANLLPQTKERSPSTSPLVKRASRLKLTSEPSKISQQQAKVPSKDLDSLKKDSNGNTAVTKKEDVSNLGIKNRSRAPTPTKLKLVSSSKSSVNENSPKKPVAKKFKKLVSGLMKTKKPPATAGINKKENSQENPVREKQNKSPDSRKSDTDYRQKEKKKQSSADSTRRPSPVPSDTEAAENLSRSSIVSRNDVLENNWQPNYTENNQVFSTDNLNAYDNQYYPVPAESYQHTSQEDVLNIEPVQQYYTDESSLQFGHDQNIQIEEANSSNNGLGQYVKETVQDPSDSVQYSQENISGNDHYESNRDEYQTYDNNEQHQVSPSVGLDQNVDEAYNDATVSGQINSQTVAYDEPISQYPTTEQPVTYDQQYITETEMYNQSPTLQYNDQAQYSQEYGQSDSQQLYGNYSNEYMQQYANDSNYNQQYDGTAQEYNMQGYIDQENYDATVYQTNYNPEVTPQGGENPGEQQIVEQCENNFEYQQQYQGDQTNDYNNQYMQDGDVQEPYVVHEEEGKNVSEEQMVQHPMEDVGAHIELEPKEDLTVTDMQQSVSEKESTDSIKQQKVLDMLDTDTESSKRNISRNANDSDSDFVTN